MPPLNDILTYMHGSWRLMNGRADGLRVLDVSADGFWNSFFAILYASPALLVGWVAIANDLVLDPLYSSRLSIIVRLAITDLGGWVLPIAGFAALAGATGLGDRFVPYVVASNWGSAVIVWITLPPSLVRLLAGNSELVTLISVVLFLLSLVLSWRLTNAAIARGPAVGSAVFGGILVATLFVLFALQAIVGLSGY